MSQIIGPEYQAYLNGMYCIELETKHKQNVVEILIQTKCFTL